jgi:hypothetical protein
MIKSIKYNWLIIFIVISFASIASNAQNFDTYQGRKEWMLKALKDVPVSGSGKQGLGKANARLWNNPHDSVALNYITNILHYKSQTMFDFPGVAYALGKYRSSFSLEQIAILKADLERLAKTDKVNGEGFLGHGTENHAAMMWTSAYLFGQYFPDAKWANGMTSAQLMAQTKEWMRKTWKNYFTWGNTEYLSTTYEVVLDYPVEILYEFAHDKEMKEMAMSFLLYRWSLLALNNYEGRVIAPYGRMNTQQDFEPETEIAGTAYYNWVLWGWGVNTNKINKKDLFAANDLVCSMFAALSTTAPDDIFFQIAKDKGLPFSLKSSTATFGQYGAGIPHMMMRKVYRDKDFAIGTGNFRWVSGGDYADYATNGFNIFWHSKDRYNYIESFHPFFYADGEEPEKRPDTWTHGSISPFEQSAAYKNVAILLFDIPQEDPWQSKPAPSRDGHAKNLIKRAMLRYPKSVDEIVEANGWIFLREGNTYVGIKPLKEYYTQKDLTGKGLDNFNIVNSDFAKTGFVFELGTENEFGSFKAFQKKLPANSLAVNWDDMTVKYKSTEGNTINMKYIPGLIKDSDGLESSVPIVMINGKTDISYDKWPMIESPFINMDNSKLSIKNGTSSINVDWSGEYPVIKRQ